MDKVVLLGPLVHEDRSHTLRLDPLRVLGGILICMLGLDGILMQCGSTSKPGGYNEAVLYFSLCITLVLHGFLCSWRLRRACARFSF